MTCNLNIKPIHNPFVQRTGELVLTKIIDLNNSLKVEIQEIYGIDLALEEFAHAAYRRKAPEFKKHEQETFPSRDRILNRIIENKALPLALECIHLRIKVTGCTRIFTHQLVRQRIGITFSQQCSGEADWRHHDIILPSCLFYDSVIKHNIQQKMLYATLLDDRKISVQEARYVLPHCLDTFIYFDASLLTVMNLYKKRTCLMTQTYEMHLFAEKLKQVILQKLPMLKDSFINPCEQGTCWYHKVKNSGTNIFLNVPDSIHDTFDWNPDNFPYQITSKEHACGDNEKPFPISYYINDTIVKEKNYRQRSMEYKAWL